MKITIVGAGAVGASCAEYIAIKNFASEVVLLDIKEGVAEGKAMDLMQCASLNGFDTRIVGSTNEYSKSAGSDIVVITSGLYPRGAHRDQRGHCKGCFFKPSRTFARGHRHCGEQPHGYHDLPGA